MNYEEINLDDKEKRDAFFKKRNKRKGGRNDLDELAHLCQSQS